MDTNTGPTASGQGWFASVKFKTCNFRVKSTATLFATDGIGWFSWVFGLRTSYQTSHVSVAAKMSWGLVCHAFATRACSKYTERRH